jgi:putative ABC transport system permease protein
VKQAGRQSAGAVPPGWMDAWLAAWCDPALLEDVQGDLHELFHRRTRRYGLLRARLHYGWDVLWFTRPYLLRRRPLTYDHARGPIMWKNYLLVALRTMRKSLLYTTINVLGLATGLAVCTLIALFVLDELSYDRQFEASDDIYRVSAVFEAQQVHSEEAMLAYPAAELLKNDFPEVVHAVRLIGIDRTPLISRGEQRFYQEGFLIADSNFFAVFDFPVLAGDPATALMEPSTVVLTRSAAERYFGDEDPMGQTIVFDTRADLTVTGVIEDLPSNTHLDFSMLASHGSIVPLYSEGVLGPLSSWGWPSTYTYIRLVPATDADALQAKLPEFMDRNEAQDALSLHLQPLTDIHLHSHLELEMAPNGDIRQVYTFSAIALLILLIACINFMNLTTARSTLRTREVGLRKVVGAGQRQIIIQFLGQSVLMTLIALVLALVMVALALPIFNDFLGKDLAVGYLSNPLRLLALIGLGLVVVAARPAGKSRPRCSGRN